MSQVERKTQSIRLMTYRSLTSVSYCQSAAPVRIIRQKRPMKELSLMQQIDALHLRYPFYGARRLRDALLEEHGLIVNRKHVRRLMVLMNIRPVYPGNKGTSMANKPKKIS